MDRKADKAQEHGEQLRRDRATVLDRIQGYHRHIDGCTAEMSEYFKCVDTEHYKTCVIEGDCERRIDEYRARVRSQQELIRSRRAEAVTLKQEAARCRAEADSSAIL